MPPELEKVTALTGPGRMLALGVGRDLGMGQSRC